MSQYEIVEKINILKDKTKFRELLRSMYPDFFYKEVTVEGLEEVDLKTLKTPFILKPLLDF